jgi:hypothetical protein
MVSHFLEQVGGGTRVRHAFAVLPNCGGYRPLAAHPNGLAQLPTGFSSRRSAPMDATSRFPCNADIRPDVHVLSGFLSR